MLPKKKSSILYITITPACLQYMVSLDYERSVRLGRLLKQFQAVEAQMRALKAKIQRLEARLNRPLRHEQLLRERLSIATEDEGFSR